MCATTNVSNVAEANGKTFNILPSCDDVNAEGGVDVFILIFHFPYESSLSLALSLSRDSRILISVCTHCLNVYGGTSTQTPCGYMGQSVFYTALP